MAKLVGPLFSLEASGAVGGALVYATWKGRPYARKYTKPLNPKAAKQLGVRAMLGFLARHWSSVSTADKATWTDLAETGNFSNFNAFTKENMNRWVVNEGPTEAYPAAETVSGTTVASFTTTGSEGYVDISGTITTATDMIGVVIYRDDAAITSPSWANTVAVLEPSGTDFSMVDTPLDAGTYHYRAAVLTNDGTIGTAIADQTASVT